MNNGSPPTGQQAISTQDWLFALLRYAVTRDDADRSSVMAIAAGLDMPGSNPQQPSSFAFFRKTTSEVCSAICADETPAKSAAIRTILDHIDDARLRRAFEAALDPMSSVRSHEGTAKIERHDRRYDLWRGLG